MPSRAKFGDLSVCGTDNAPDFGADLSMERQHNAEMLTRRRPARQDFSIVAHYEHSSIQPSPNGATREAPTEPPQAPISARMASAAARESGAAVTGRPTTR